jgi:hypothetical protein
MATKKAATKTAGRGGAKKPAAKSAAKPAGKTAVKSPVKRFRALVERNEGSAVCSIHFPFDVEQTFGARGHVPVRGTLNGAPFRASIFKMGGRHFMVVNRRLREASGVSGGETVPVVVERDTEPRVVDAPADFARALEGSREAQAAWDNLSFTHRREHVEHIEEAKKPETRDRRIEKSVRMLAAGRKEPR